MLKVHIRLPLNISRSFEEILREHVEGNPGKYPKGVKLISSHNYDGEEASNQQPAGIMIGFMPEIEMQSDEDLLQNFVSIPGGFPIRKELLDLGFADPRGFFHVFGIVPFIIFYHPDHADAGEIPRTWGDLLDPRWKGRIAMPGKEHIAPRIVRAVLKYENPQRAEAVDENIICRGVPPNVIESVKNGEFSLGIANITFGKISEGLKIRTIWPKDGLLCAPQIIIWRKGAAEKMIGLGDFLLSPQVQGLLSQQAFVPSAPGTGFPPIFRENSVKLKWDGWDHFRAAMKKSHI